MRLVRALCLAPCFALVAGGGGPAAGFVDAGAIAGALAVPAPVAQVPASFVRVRGSQFTLGDQPFHFVGANLAIMHGPEARADAGDVLAAAARDGISVGRIWALGEGNDDAAPWLRDNFLFRAGPDGWVDAATDHLDRVIAAAGRAGVRLIVTLANNWSDYGGAPRYLQWAGQARAGVYGVGDRFYSDRRARAAYRAHVERLLARTNHVTGIRYRDDPTILAWELMNESTATTAAGAIARRAWIVEMARMIHAADPNHLVSPGVGGYRVERERQDWLAICRLPDVDFCDGHVYPDDLLQDRDGSTVDAVLDDYVRLTRGLAGKPFVLGEFGVRGDGQGRWQGQRRATWVARILERLRVDGAAGGLIWIYQSARGLDRAHGISVGAPGATPATESIRAAVRAAAAALAAPTPGTAADAADAWAGDQSALMPLHAQVVGRTPSTPLVDGATLGRAPVLTVTWNPPAFARAEWEASGFYAGGAVEHAWGGETGWFEYEYEIVAKPSLAAPARGTQALRAPRALIFRARLSSEYPGTLSPLDGASAFEVFLDDVRLVRAIAPRDDGRGRWVTLRVTGRDVPACATAPGRHRLRLAVPAGPRAHGLAVYGRPGAKPDRSVDDTGPIELRFEWRVAAGPGAPAAQRPDCWVRRAAPK